MFGVVIVIDNVISLILVVFLIFLLLLDWWLFFNFFLIIGVVYNIREFCIWGCYESRKFVFFGFVRYGCKKVFFYGCKKVWKINLLLVIEFVLFFCEWCGKFVVKSW